MRSMSVRLSSSPRFVVLKATVNRAIGPVQALRGYTDRMCIAVVLSTGKRWCVSDSAILPVPA